MRVPRKKRSPAKPSTTADPPQETDDDVDQSSKQAASGQGPDGRFLPGNPHAYKPGQSGNAGGRPRSVSLSAAYKQRLARYCDNETLNPTGELTWAEVISLGMVTEAAIGKVAASKELREATEGTRVNVSADWRSALQAMNIDPDKAMEILMTEVGNAVS